MLRERERARGRSALRSPWRRPRRRAHVPVDHGCRGGRWSESQTERGKVGGERGVSNERGPRDRARREGERQRTGLAHRLGALRRLIAAVGRQERVASQPPICERSMDPREARRQAGSRAGLPEAPGGGEDEGWTSVPVVAGLRTTNAVVGVGLVGLRARERGGGACWTRGGGGGRRGERVSSLRG